MTPDVSRETPLVVPHHGAARDELVARYPYAERAIGFLVAKDLDPAADETGHDEPGDDDEAPVPSLSALDVRP